MNGGSWPAAKCSSGWAPAPTEPAISAPSQPQMGINSNFPSRFPVSQELPVFNGLNPISSQPCPSEPTNQPLPLLSGKYPHFQSSPLGSRSSNNGLQVNSTGFTPVLCGHPFLESHGKEAQNSLSQGGSSKTVNMDHTQRAYRVQTLDFRAPQKTPVNAILSSWHGDQRLVFCMNAVGELFFADSGHLGVICFCHRSKMSVAKFCEHSGGIGNKAGESVYMENGMTISRWARFFLGVNSTHWDWPNSSSLQAALIPSNSLDSSIVRPNNRTVDQNQLHKVGPQTSETNPALNRNLNEHYSFLSANYTSAAISTGIPNSGVCTSAAINTSIPNSGFQLVSHIANGSNFTGNKYTSAAINTSIPNSGVWNNVRNEEDSSSSYFPSRFELKLGQPPNLISNSSKGVIPASMQLTTVVDVQATYSHPVASKEEPKEQGDQNRPETDLSSSETSRPLQNPQKEDSNLNQIPVNTNTTTNIHPHSTSPSEDFTSDSTKNSFISLFLSHLERKNPVESGDDILGNTTDSLRGSDERALDKCKNGFARVCDENPNSNLFRAGELPCTFTDALRTCSPHSENLNLKQLGFELMDNSWHKPERCARACETTHLHGRMCCLSNLKFQNSFGQDDNNKVLHEELVHKFQCGTHSDVCKFPVRCIPSCLVCSREQLSVCCTHNSEKALCISSTHETIPTCGAHCISGCHRSAISLLEEDRDHIIKENKRPKLSSQCECSWKDVPGKNFLGKDFPLKDTGTLLIRDKEISSTSLGSSAPAITEVSVETDRECEVGPAGMSVSVPVPVDEASLVEKCGSSDEKYEICRTIQPSVRGTTKSSPLERERATSPIDSLTKRPRNDARLVKRDKKSVELVQKRTMNHSKTKEAFSMKNRKDKQVDQANRRSECCPIMDDANLEKKRKENSVCSGPLNHPESNETSSEKKVETLVDLVHHGPEPYSKISEAFAEDREETTVAEVPYQTVSSFKANATFSEKKWKDTVNPVCDGPMTRLEARKQPKYKYLSQIGTRESDTKNINSFHSFCAKRNKPIVCGNLGIISNGMTDDALKPVKIVSLVSVLEKTKPSSDKILKNKPETVSPLACEKPRLHLRKSMGPVRNNLKNEAFIVKPTSSQSARKCQNFQFNEFGEYSEKMKRAKMKSISLDVMERERTSKSEHPSESVAGLVQEELNNETHVTSSLTSGECQLLPASGGNKPSYAEECEQLSLSESACSVCRSSVEEDINKILRCQHCRIMVHQACYGISRQPKGPWFCRPCKAGFFNPVCVLCGFQGGAMTRAQKTRKLVNSLIKYVHEPGFGIPDIQLQGANGNHSIVHWVHMVCGLWTPSTRCPNVNTMAAFDLSGTSPSRKNSICSVCKRPGGSCVKCRVFGCTMVFHPWCAHQKGLLQNEVEGEDCEKVGFYGRCIYHGTINVSHGEHLYVEENKNYASNEGWTCARTEVFKGQKREQNANSTSNNITRRGDSSTCIVSEEQKNAWLRINGQKPFTDMAAKSLSLSDVEPDLQKEYMRYKQQEELKHLVVYKSSIHGLGLYTSCFIPHGAMVAEYVGELVRLRVADKREKEYQSRQKLHSKSACYFFRIDEENIIDATRKGGIARFVNHSCSANCVAKIISVSNEKKVVFIAERDIYPGEEITYDYHFNPENEGEKIPCFCNSKNCRRFLN